MNAVSAKCGHVKRLLMQGNQLTGELLEFSLSGMNEKSGDKLLDGICRKLRPGQQLTEYEQHILVDVILLHIRVYSERPVRKLTQKA